MESNFVALELVGRNVEWLIELVADVPLREKSAPLLSLHYDNQASIVVAKNKFHNGKRRHI